MIKVFNYIENLDCFLVTKEFADICNKLYLSEWNPVVWIGRYLMMDNDYGEHIFDNWDERETLAKRAKEKGYNLTKETLVKWGDQTLDENAEIACLVIPDRFVEPFKRCLNCKKDFDFLPCSKCKKLINVKPDGPCHSSELRKRFWTDLFKSLHISYETLFEQAKFNAKTYPENKQSEILSKIKQEINKINNE